ncbi:hypothetical protein HY642_05810 [Candidatus Woesearchaeota archaeon]|nr:hypothetical protein [Candidatus Woesearchaeota archaeon]
MRIIGTVRIFRQDDGVYLRVALENFRIFRKFYGNFTQAHIKEWMRCEWMDIAAFRKLVKGLTEENIAADQPHVNHRCEEYGLSFDHIRRVLLDTHAPMLRVVQGRSAVCKVYYRCGRGELKIIVDALSHRKLCVRTIKLLGKDRSKRWVFIGNGLEENHGDW